MNSGWNTTSDHNHYAINGGTGRYRGLRQGITYVWYSPWPRVCYHEMKGGSSLGTCNVFCARLAVVLGATLLMIPAVALAAEDHPASGQITGDPDQAYGTAGYGFPAEYSRGDLTFGSAYPAVDALMPPERYMLAGTLGVRNGDANEKLPAWITSIEEFCIEYIASMNELPSQITADTLIAIHGAGSQSSKDQALLLNPITGKAPRLDAIAYSPGDLYVRALSSDEVDYYASRNLVLRDLWINGIYKDLDTGRSGKVSLVSPVFYVRAYGVQGVIYENFAYRLSEPDFSVPVTVAKAPEPKPIENDWGWVDTGCVPSG